MAQVIAIVNQKGGVGKTTTAVNLCATLNDMGRRVLLCDFDPQANASSGMGIDRSRRRSGGIYSVLSGERTAREAVVATPYGDVIPSGSRLTGAGLELIDMDRRELRLRDALDPLREDYDYIFIDSPPSLELLTLNALCAADSILIPVQCEYYALEGLTDLLSTLRSVKRRMNTGLSIFGILLTMYDNRTRYSRQVAEEVRSHFPDQVFRTVIPRNVRLSEAPSHGMPVMAYDRVSRGAAAYRDLAAEIGGVK